MNANLRILLLVVFLSCFLSPPTLAATVPEIEKLPFDVAYGLWFQETETLIQKRKNGSMSLSWGSRDSKTGKFTPTRFFALTCRLGRDAHVHESFLVRELKTNEYVTMIFDASSRLCDRYGVESEARVVFDPEQGYSTRPRNLFLGADVRKRVWLEAMTRSNSQPDGTSNGSQPNRAETIETSSAAGSRR